MKKEKLIEQLKNYNQEDLKELSRAILELLSNSSTVDSLQLTHCKKCNSIHIVKFGKDKNNKQRYRCKSCGCTFTATSYSTISKTHGSLQQWEKYIELLINGKSLRYSAQACKISLPTAFLWRHKILSSLQHDQDNRVLDGVIEIDDTFFKESYKGNHSKSNRFVMPRALIKEALIISS